MEGQRIFEQTPVQVLEPPAPPPEPVANQPKIIEAEFKEHARSPSAREAGDDSPGESQSSPANFDFEKIASDFEAQCAGVDSESILNELRDAVFDTIDGQDVPRAIMTRIQNAYEKAASRFPPPPEYDSALVNEAPPAPPEAPAIPVTTPEEEQDAQLALKRDAAAITRQLARQKARTGRQKMRLWLGSLSEADKAIVLEMREYREGILQAWADDADAKKPKDDF
jgi:hypothetical protein